jgi:TolB-like protein/Tfp pilus assembly protein PilF
MRHPVWRRKRQGTANHGKARQPALKPRRPDELRDARSWQMITSRMHETDPGQGSRASSAPLGPRLESWKEIAAYLGRDVTTVQRWERREGLPVHRLLHAKIGSVFAYTLELESWRATRSHQASAAPPEAAATPGGTALVGDEPVRPVDDGGDDTARGPAPGDATRRAGAVAPAGIRPRHEGRLDNRWVTATLAVLLLVTSSLLAWEVWGRRVRPAASGPIQTIAVLPLRNLSGDASQEYFADGMTEAVIARLASLGDLQVTSRTSIMQFKNVDTPIPDIARALGADAILEGSVHRSGDRVRVIAQLIDGRTDAHLWAAEFDREVRDVLLLQGELAQAIVSRVSATVREPAARQAAAAPVSSEAYEHYLKGRFLLAESSLDSVQRSIKEFQAAIAVDPAFAPAYAGLASAHTDLGTVLIGATPGAESVDRAIAAANEAIARDPYLAEAHSVLGRALMGQWRWRESEAEFRRALDLNPSDARTHYWFAEWLIAHHRTDEAVASARHGRDLDPLSMRVGAEFGLMLGFARRPADAVSQLRSVLAVQPDHVQARWWLGTNLVDLGRPDEAIATLERAAALSARSSAVLAQLARAYAKVGRRADAERIRVELTTRRGAQYVPPNSIGTVYVALGERDAAIQWYTRAVDEKANGLQFLWAMSANIPLRDDPRFVALIARMGLPAAPPPATR